MAEIPPYIRLFCEGYKTEPNYFIPYFKAKGFHQPNMASKPKNHDPKGVAKAAKDAYNHAKKVLKIPEDKIFIWAVFDRDGHAGVPEAIDLLRGTPIGIAFSNVCFEYWILLHYENTARSFRNCDEIISYIHHNHDPNYGKANDHYMRLKEKISLAISRAQQLARHQRQHATRPDSMLEGSNDHNFPDSPNWTINPYTDVHLIFESLRAKGFITDF
jgi:RloB-like protein